VKDIMKTDIIKIPRNMSLTEVISFGEQRHSVQPVVNGGDELVGMITNTSILKVLSQNHARKRNTDMETLQQTLSFITNHWARLCKRQRAHFPVVHGGGPGVPCRIPVGF
jgi:predicted transcriptional regulator